MICQKDHSKKLILQIFNINIISQIRQQITLGSNYTKHYLGVGHVRTARLVFIKKKYDPPIFLFSTTEFFVLKMLEKIA